MKRIEKSVKIGDKKLTLTAGYMAMQASGSVVATYGETVVLATVVAANLKEDRGYFPLSVMYEEKLYSTGRIKGSRWVKRKGRPIDREILTSRLIDRSIRPLFSKDYVGKDVQVVLTVLSSDHEHIPDMVAAAATSAAIEISPIPWAGPMGTVRIAKVGKKFVTNPLKSELEKSEMDLIVSSTKDAVVMVEMGGNEVEEADVVKAIEYSQSETAKLISFIKSFAKEVGVRKEAIEKIPVDAGIQKKVQKLTDGQLLDLAGKMATKEAGYDQYDEVKYAVVAEFEEEDKATAAKVFEQIFQSEVKKLMLSGKRLDGRKNDELRKLSSEIAVLPRTHGTGLFMRGQTQALSIATLGSSSLEQLIETIDGESKKRYIHHYEMPPYSSGETGRMFPSRREIGHGALAEKALAPVLPTKEEFPYTIRVMSQILSSNGSTSMASVCGSSLSMMDAGVPLKAAVAGIAMGVVMEDPKKYSVLTDIVGIEDGSGDMDFKVAGTQKGITALQLDVKTLMLTPEILKVALTQAKKAREEILSVMSSAIKAPKKSVSSYAPKIKIIKIAVDKIGELIGPSGKIIKKLIEETGTEINVEDDGSVTISAVDPDSVQSALEKVEAITKEVQPGEIYKGIVKRLQPFGAFVEILPGKDGLVHVSDMSTEYVKDPADILKIDQEIEVRVKEVDDFKRINLSMLLDGDKEKPAARRDDRRNDRGQRRQFGGGGGRQRGRQGQRQPGRFNRDSGGNRRDNRSKGGPHFPTSRLVDVDKKGFNR